MAKARGPGNQGSPPKKTFKALSQTSAAESPRRSDTAKRPWYKKTWLRLWAGIGALSTFGGLLWVWPSIEIQRARPGQTGPLDAKMDFVNNGHFPVINAELYCEIGRADYRFSDGGEMTMNFGGMPFYKIVLPDIPARSKITQPCAPFEFPEGTRTTSTVYAAIVFEYSWPLWPWRLTERQGVVGEYIGNQQYEWDYVPYEYAKERMKQRAE
jgi:hypothetical protein